MRSCSSIERAKPLLGTYVSVRVHGLEPERAHQAIDAAFLEVEAIHRLMSFHDEESEVSRLNRDAHNHPVQVDPSTYEVLSRARVLSAASDGTFDITVAPDLVARGLLPRPRGAPDADPSAIWRDVALLADFFVAYRRPLWTDLGGIAKGYAVDRAIDALKPFCPTRACLNAGGDLRMMGAEHEQVQLDIDWCQSEQVPLIDIVDGSVASSSGAMSGRWRDPAGKGPHVDSRCGRSQLPRQFVSVMAPRCIDADALTKVVMARGACSARILAAFSAQAVVYDAQFGWREIAGHA